MFEKFFHRLTKEDSLHQANEMQEKIKEGNAEDYQDASEQIDKEINGQIRESRYAINNRGEVMTPDEAEAHKNTSPEDKR